MQPESNLDRWWRKYLKNKPKPVVCCECGDRPSEQGEIPLRKIGWQGFSRLAEERLGMCPTCVWSADND